MDAHLCIFCEHKRNPEKKKKACILQTAQKGFQRNYQAWKESYLWKVTKRCREELNKSSQLNHLVATVYAKLGDKLLY